MKVVYAGQNRPRCVQIEVETRKKDGIGFTFKLPRLLDFLNDILQQLSIALAGRIVCGNNSRKQVSYQVVRRIW